MTSEKIDVFLSFLRDCEQRYRMAEAEEQEAASATQDILHSLELEEHSEEEYTELAEELREVRRQRRRAKDTMSETGPILIWLDQNRAVIKGIERLLGDVRKAERAAEGRIYTPRTKRVNNA